MEWTSVLSALIGATAALAGSAFTRRAERRRDIADRLWAERLKLYEDLLSWVADARAGAQGWITENDLRPTAPLPNDTFGEQNSLPHLASLPVSRRFSRASSF